MRLINTIEISPYNYSKNEYEYPNRSSSESPDEWNEFWLKCISDSNLGSLRAFRKGSYLVDIETLNEIEIEEILKNQLKEIEIENFEEQVGRLCGGIVIIENDISLIEPNCCGDIGNTSEWESIFENRPKNWAQLWIGHPWVYYKTENGMIKFSDYTESKLEDFSEIKPMFEISEKELRKEIEKIRKQQNEFEWKIREILEKMNISNAERISKLMTGNE